MPECNHEEADTRIVVHALHAIQADQAKSVLVRTVDTDVIVILIRNVPSFQGNPAWLGLVGGTWNRTEFLIYLRQHYLCWSRWSAIEILTRVPRADWLWYDPTFYGKDKKSAWHAWELYPGITPTFEFLANNPFHQLSVDSDHFKRIERFTVILFNNLSPLESINKARMELFCKNNREMNKLPPTQVNMTAS